MGADAADPRRQVNLVLPSTQAEQVDIGTFKFDLEWFKHRVSSASLGTMELPNSQYLIEEQWSQIRFDEGLALRTDNERTLRILPLKSGKRPRKINEDLVRVIKIPLRHNRVRGVNMSVSPGEEQLVRLEVKLQHEHGVVSPSGHSLVTPYDIGIGVILCPSGLSLTNALSIEYVDELTFVASFPHSRETLGAARYQQEVAYAGSLCSASIAGPAQLARILANSLRAFRCGGSISVFPPHFDKVSIRNALVDSSCGLARALGIRCKGWSDDTNEAPYCGKVTLRPGNYGAGALLQRLEHGFRPLRFGKDSNMLFITGPDGRVVPVTFNHPVGYSLYQMEQTINAALGTVNSALRGVHVGTDPQGYVTIRAGNPQTFFSLNFDVPASIDATMLGFEMVAYEGASSYTGSHAVHYPRVGVHGEEPRLQYRVNAQEEQRVLTLQATRYRFNLQKGSIAGGAMPPLHAGDLCYNAKLGFVHVADDFPQVEYTTGEDQMMVPVMKLRFEETADDADLSGVFVCNPDRTFALHMNPSNSKGAIKPAILGFEPRTYEPEPFRSESAVVGPVMVNSAYTAPNILHIEQVPYVLVELANGSAKPTTLQRSVGVNGVITPFAKVCFAPYRVERVNPAEVHFPSGESLHPFTITFRNPDGTIYNTHGSPFSISLTVTTAHA
jgi:hypothetical protein